MVSTRIFSSYMQGKLVRDLAVGFLYNLARPITCSHSKIDALGHSKGCERRRTFGTLSVVGQSQVCNKYCIGF